MAFESFSNPEEWDLVNFRLKDELNTTNQIRSYINPFLAMNDLLVTLAQLYAHKRSVAWVTGISPLLENSQPHFVREGYQIQNIKMSDLATAADQGQSLIEALPKDTVFLVFFKDHALSGETFSYEKIEEWCAAKKIFFILVSHEFDSSFVIQPNSIGLQCISPGFNIVRLPERTKLGSAIGAYQNIKWQNEWSAKLKVTNIDLSVQITQWESTLSQTKWPCLGKRSGNRALIKFDSLHGEMLVTELKSEGFRKVISFADCVSNSPKSIRSWLHPALSDEDLRGLVLFNFTEPQDLPPRVLIDEIVSKIKSESGWTF
jgi:hypothetical protein